MNGPILHLPIDDYHASDYVSSSKLTDLAPCPLYYKRKHIDKAIPRVESEAFAIGNAGHWLILEGSEAFRARTAIQPETYPAPESAKKDAPIVQKPWHNGATFCKEWNAAQVGKVILSKQDERLMLDMWAAVAANPDASALLTGGQAEVTFRKDLGVFGVQCRTDYWHANGVTIPSIGRVDGPVVTDLKTCDTIERFKKDFFEMRYHFRAEFYRLVIREVLAEAGELALSEIPEPRFFFVAVEKSEPHRVEVFEPDAESLEVGKREVRAALLQLSQCYRSGEWPGSKPGVQSIGLKSWQLRVSEEATAAVLEKEAA